MTTTWLAIDGYWTAYGRQKVPHGAPVPEDEWPPTLKTYKPGPTTTGPRPGEVLTRYDGDYVIDQPNQAVHNLDIYGRIVVKSTGTNATVRNCIVRGPGGLSAWSSGFTAVITGSSSSLKGLLVEDSRLDLTGRENPFVDGIRESDATLRRVEITRTCDGASCVSKVGNVVYEGCWIHNGAYIEWSKGTPGWPTQSDARTHCDAVQLQRGTGYIFTGCALGGSRKPGPYHLSPYTSVDAAMVAYKNSGGDYENSCVFAKQEVSALPTDHLGTALFDGCWFEGGAASVNLSYSNSNPLAGLTFLNCHFERSTWDVENTAVTGHAQLYIIRDTAITSTITNPTFTDNGATVPITKGITN